MHRKKGERTQDQKSTKYVENYSRERKPGSVQYYFGIVKLKSISLLETELRGTGEFYFPPESHWSRLSHD